MRACSEQHSFMHIESMFLLSLLSLQRRTLPILPSEELSTLFYQRYDSMRCLSERLCVGSTHSDTMRTKEECITIMFSVFFFLFMFAISGQCEWCLYELCCFELSFVFHFVCELMRHLQKWLHFGQSDQIHLRTGFKLHAFLFLLLLLLWLFLCISS